MKLTASHNNMGNEKDNETPPELKPDDTADSGKGQSSQRSKNRVRRNRNNKRRKMRNAQKPATQSAFKGSINDMNGYVFECYGESHTSTQFSIMCEELQSYATIHYKNGSDVQYMIKHFKDPTIKELEDTGTKALTATQKRIWGKSIDQYVIRLEQYRQYKDSLYDIIWAQCSSAMQAKLKMIQDYDDMDETLNCLELL